MSVKPERRSGASPAEVANKKPVKGVLKIGTVEMWLHPMTSWNQFIYIYFWSHFNSFLLGRAGIVLPALTVC